MDCSWPAFLLLLALGGVVCALVAVLVGGIGGWWQLARSVRLLADRIDDVDGKIESEVKRRAGSERHRPRESAAEALEALVAAGPAPGAAPGGRAGGASVTRTEILAEGRRKGLLVR